MLLVGGLVLTSTGWAQETAEHLAVGEHGVVASVQPLATEAGIAAFRRGGNAIDAAVSTALTLGVVDNHNSGIGGGCFILIRKADGQLLAIDGREAAPLAGANIDEQPVIVELDARVSVVVNDVG